MQVKQILVSGWLVAATAISLAFFVPREVFAETDLHHFARLAQRSGHAAVIPSYFRASIWVKNGGGRCSGGIFLKGPKYAFGLSAAHCFQGKIGGRFVAGNIYGETCYATLLAHKPSKDLALWRIPTEYAHGVVCVPGSIPSGVVFEKLGFTGGKGPVLADVRFKGRTADPGTICHDCGVEHVTGLEFAVVDGRFGKGDSGGYVFAIPKGNPSQGMLTAIISGGEGDIDHGQGHEIFGPGLKEVNTFLSDHWHEFTQYGPFNIQDEYG